MHSHFYPRLRPIIIAAILIFAALWSTVKAQDDREHKATTSQPSPAAPVSKSSQPVPMPSDGAAPSDPAKEVETSWDKLKCGSPRSHDEADLCEQRRMAHAAEQALTLNWLQVGLGVGGFFALLISIHLTRKSTNAAIKAANAAEAQVRTNRAWLCNDGYNSGRWMNGSVSGQLIRNGFVFHIKWKNVGGTPALAINVNCVHQLAPLGSEAPPFPKMVDEDSPSHGMVGPGGTFSTHNLIIDDRESELFRTGRHVLFVYSSVSYNDIYSQEQRLSEVCMAVECWGVTETDKGPEYVLSVHAAGPQNTGT